VGFPDTVVFKQHAGRKPEVRVQVRRRLSSAWPSGVHSTMMPDAVLIQVPSIDFRTFIGLKP